jgi:hypothetical protein
VKPFDLEAAKRGEPMVSRDGRKVIHFHHIETDAGRLNCVVQFEGSNSCGWTSSDGRQNSVSEDDNDLFMAPKKRTVYVQVFGIAADAGGVPALRAVAFENKADAERNVVMTTFPVLVAVLPVEIEG